MHEGVEGGPHRLGGYVLLTQGAGGGSQVDVMAEQGQRPQGSSGHWPSKWGRAGEVQEGAGVRRPNPALGIPFGPGFITMTPQLFINYKLKSVAHLPWRMLTYKALNTFIDDLFAFVIKMPVMYRIGCLRDGEWRRAQSPGVRQSGTGWCLPTVRLTAAHTALAHACRRCGLLHLPLPTVDLPRRPHQGE